MLIRFWCDECQNEFEVSPIHETEDELKPKVCPFCKSSVDDFFYDAEEDGDIL